SSSQSHLDTLEPHCPGSCPEPASCADPSFTRIQWVALHRFTSQGFDAGSGHETVQRPRGDRVSRILNGIKPADLRAGDQYEDRQSSRPDDPPVAPGASRRAHPVMTRRTFLCEVTLGTLSVSLAAGAQPSVKVRRIGFLRPGPPLQSWVEALRHGLRDLGYVEGKSIVIEVRFTDGGFDKLPDLASELLRLNVDVIVASGTLAALAATHLSRTVPIAVVGANDPVGAGLVKELSRPGGNITGLTNQTPDLGMKRVQLLKEVIPRLARLAVLGNPTHPAYASQVKTIETGVRALGGQVELIAVRSPNDFEAAFRIQRAAQRPL